MRQALASLVVGLGSFVAAPLSASGQPTPPDPAARRTAPTFLTGSRFHLDAARLVTDHVAFDWAAELGGDIDLVDFGRGRLNGLVNFEAVLGHERGAFDPTQGNYTLAVRVDWRVAASEVGAVFHHVSRHLSDRAKSFPIDWNMIGLVARRRMERGSIRVDGASHLLVATKRSFVDYRTEIGVKVAATQLVNPRATAFVTGDLIVRGVAREVFGRGTLVGGRLESGVRLMGARTGLDLFVAVERRIDADPLELQTRTWMLTGFRIVSP